MDTIVKSVRIDEDTLVIIIKTMSLTFKFEKNIL
jgi:hypothetical protein